MEVDAPPRCDEGQHDRRHMEDAVWALIDMVSDDGCINDALLLSSWTPTGHAEDEVCVIWN